jgi:hypothetical protein
MTDEGLDFLVLLLFPALLTCGCSAPEDRLEAARAEQACRQYFEGGPLGAGRMISSQNPAEQPDYVEALSAMLEISKDWVRWSEELEVRPIAPFQYFLEYTLDVSDASGQRYIYTDTNYCAPGSTEDPVPLEDHLYRVPLHGKPVEIRSRFLWKGDFDVYCLPPE